MTEYKSWVCLICGWIYNEEDGLPDEGIPAGTRFADIPADWRCPLCDVGKAEFAVVEFCRQRRHSHRAVALLYSGPYGAVRVRAAESGRHGATTGHLGT